MRIGLLGGSFNPAHAGHVHISRRALDALALDGIWWLVSPQNPLKAKAGMAPFAERVASAKSMATEDPAIKVSSIEQKLDTRYTVDTVSALQARYSQHRFVWLMGADNLAQLHRWHAWQQLARRVPLAILDRGDTRKAVLRSAAARILAPFQWPASQSSALADAAAPAWVFLRGDRHPASATVLRQKGAWPKVAS